MRALAAGELDAVFDEGIALWLDDALAAGMVPLELDEAGFRALEALGWRRVVLRAGIIAAPGKSRTEATARPEPGPGQVLLRLEGSGVCASSIPMWEGREWFQYPQPAGAPGHEGWGVVAAVGEGVRAVKEGQRVAALSYRAHAEYDIADASAVVPTTCAAYG